MDVDANLLTRFKEKFKVKFFEVFVFVGQRNASDCAIPTCLANDSNSAW